MSLIRVVLAGGGTGGHAYPAISVGQALRNTDPLAELLFVGSCHGPEREIAEAAGIAFEGVPSSSLTRSISLRNAASLGRLALGVLRARRLLTGFAPDVVFGTGGYAAAAAVVAQKSRRGRVVIHEQNSVPGRTNLWLARFADVICLSSESAARFFTRGNTHVTGMPIRAEFAVLPGKREARRILGMNPEKFSLLAVGGSQGARKINELVMDAWPRIADGNTQLLHQVGRSNLEEMRERASAESKEDYRIEALVDTPLALAAADLVIARSGASTLAEITAAGLPSILIPYPHAYADHQTANAADLTARQAAVVCAESELTADRLAELVEQLRSEETRLSAMADAARSLARPDAAARVAHVITSLVAGRN